MGMGYGKKQGQPGLYLDGPPREKEGRWPGRTLSPGGRLGAPRVRTSYLAIVEGKLGPTPDWNPP